MGDVGVRDSYTQCLTWIGDFLESGIFEMISRQIALGDSLLGFCFVFLLPLAIMDRALFFEEEICRPESESST